MESILDGTWNSGAEPPEWTDFILMRRMHWSWAELQETPDYVRRYCVDFLALIAKQERDEHERAQAAHRR
ncbi:hypothetical protein [Kitasatospora aureofaciens]|uniref:hypothetical protein n=1 Tax=Kitasatospora aureofaciens TaxID=1894 RepID=UPI0033E5F5F2